MKIYITAIVKSKPEFLTEVENVLKNMVVQTREEDACILYDLHQSKSDKNVFIFYEIWENQSGLDQHNQQAYIQEFVEMADKKLEKTPEIYLTEKL